MKVAYLVNQYPKVSHTFVRREVRALEALGAQIARFSVRGSPDLLVDPDDLDEVGKTRVILSVGAVGLLLAVLRAVATRPIALARTLLLALSTGWGSERGVLIHLIYVAEACVLRGWLAEADCTHVHAHFGTNSAAVAMLCNALGGPSFSFTVHGPEEFDKAPLIALAEKIKRARFVVAISSYGRSQLFRLCSHAHWSKIKVVRCGLDADFLHAALTPIPSVPRMVSVGRLSEQKGQLLLIEAAAMIAAKQVPFELVLVGDGEMRPEVEAAIQRHGLGERVRITGWASNEQVREHLRSGRLMVLPSFAEGLPVVIMEALALGRPVLSTYVAGIPELVSPACGWLVPAGSVEALAACMEKALATPTDTVAELGLEGQRRVRRDHDAMTEAQRLIELFAASPPAGL